MTDAPLCCTIGCDKPAKYQIWFKGQPYEPTQSCADHVFEMMQDVNFKWTEKL